MRTQTIQLFPSDWKVDVIVTKSRKKAINYQVKTYGLKKELLKEEPQHLNTVATVHSGTKSKRKGESRILLILKDLSPGIVVHEINHVIWHYSKAAKVEITYESQEWSSLLLEYLFNQVTNKKNYKKV